MKIAEAFVEVQMRLDDGTVRRAKSTAKSAVDAMEKKPVKLKVDNAGVDKGMKDAERSVTTATNSMAETFARVFTGAAVIAGFKDAIDAASDLGESINAVNVTFGPAADGIVELGEGAATALGLSEAAFNGLAVQFSGFANQIAGPGGDVTAVLDDLTTRAADFASVMNIDVADAAATFQSTLAGETEAIRAYGIDVSAAAVDTFAYANGIAEAGVALTEAQKVQARYGLLMQETSKFQGDFANTSDSAANAQRILAAEFENAKAKLGSALIPIFQQAVKVLTELVEGFSSLPAPVQAGVLAMIGIAAVAGPVKDAAAAFGGLSKVIGGLGSVTPMIAGVALAAGGAFLAWKILGQGHLNASTHIDTASDALANATRAAYDEATAAGEATTATEALAIAHTALSNAIALAASDELSDAFARMNVTADEFLDTLMGFGPSGSAEGLDSIAMSAQLAEQAFGLASGEGEIFMDLVRSGRYTNEELAASIGVTTGEVDSFRDALVTVTQYGTENRDEIDAMALAYLNSQGSIQGAAHEALIAAEAIAGSRFEAGNAVPVYEEFIRQLTLLDPAAAAAALAVADAGGAAAGASGGLEATTEAAAAMRDVFARIGLDEPIEQLSALEDVAQFGRHALIEIAEAAGVTTESAERLVGAMSSLSGPDFLAWVADTHPDLLELATGLLAISEAANITSGKLQLVINPAKEMRGELVSGAKAIGGAADATELAAGTIAHAADEIDDMADITSDATSQFDDLSAAADRLADAINQVVSPGKDLRDSVREVYASAQDLVDGFAETAKAAHDAGDSYDVNSDALANNTEAGRDNQENLQAAADAILAHGVAMVENGASAEEAAGDIAFNTKALHDNLIAAGFSETAVADLIEQYNLTPEQVATILSLEGEAHANEVIDRYNAEIAGIPDAARTYIEAKIAEGDIAAAEAALNYAARYREAIIHVRQTGHFATSDSHNQAYAEGGYISHPQLAFIGEAGREAVLPLERPSKLRDLLGDPRIAGPVAAALGGTTTTYGGTTTNIGTIVTRDAAGVRDELERIAWLDAAVPVPRRVR